ncbi:hypothetical protein JOL79_18240 [Microbispora sp. RL4-1S]|uniref:Uncharacterized protein n=1 Tax=Microbispora oryzae TaxID=2806554 RepID=A0A940WRN4_9ACTN|nr:hypothetical protein [Microbispora oryzae]MBP2705759.1 hypothetical protein [Microbispora oryzae]
MDKSRVSAVAALLITGFAIVYVVGSAIAGWEPSSGWLIRAIIHIGELLAVAALAFSDAGGRSRVARTGLAAAIGGQLIIAAAEVIWPSNPDLGDALFSVSPILTGAGLITAGVAVIRAGVWAGSSRFLPLTLGLYTILVLIPVMIGSGGPPAPLALWTIGGWDLLWLVLSAGVLGRTRTALPSDPATAKVTIR